MIEYKVVKIAKSVLIQTKDDPTINVDKIESFEEALNKYGKDGWDLIELIQPSGFLGLGDIGYCIFKRVKK